MQKRFDSEFPKWNAEKQNGVFKNYASHTLDNCGEYSAINNALNDKAIPQNLLLYSITLNTGTYMAPCKNCRNLYNSYVNFIS